MTTQTKQFDPDRESNPQDYCSICNKRRTWKYPLLKIAVVDGKNVYAHRACAKKSNTEKKG